MFIVDRVDLARLHWNDTLNFTDLLYDNHPQSILQLLKVAHTSRTRQTIEMLLNAVDFAIATNNNNTAIQLLEQQKFYENNTSVWALHNEDGDDTIKGYARFNWCN